MIRNGSRGATPLDSPRLGSDIGDVVGDVAGDDVKATAGHEPGAPPTDGASAIESAVSTGPAPTEGTDVAIGKSSTRAESPLDAVKASPEAASELGSPRVAAEPEAAPAAEAGPDLPLGASPANDVERAPSMVSGKIREFADERTAKALGANVSSIKALGRTAEQAKAQMSAMTQAVRGATLEDGTPVFRPFDHPDVLAQRVAQAQQETTAKLAAFRQQAAEVFAEHPEIAPSPNAIADRIQRDVISPLQNHPSAGIRATADAIGQHVEDIRALADAPPDEAVAKLTQIRQTLDGEIYKTKRGVNLPQQGAAPELKDLQKARMLLEESIEAASDKASTFFPGGQAGEYKRIKTQWRNLDLATQISGANQLADVGRRVVSPSDYGAGIAGAAMGGGPVGALASMAANKVLREHGSAVAAVLADKLANTLDGKIDSGLGSFFRESSARATAGASGVANAVASLPAVPIRRIATPAAVDAFMGKSKDLPAAYQKRVNELVNVTQQQGTGVREAVIQAMGGAGDALPQLAAAATMTATKGAQYLQSQIPGSTVAPTVFQPTRKVTPSDLEIREFAQKWAAVSNPLSVVDDLRRGTVTHAQIDAIKNVYPAMYAEIQMKTLEKIRQQDLAGKPMPFADRLQLDLFLDLNGAGEPTLAGQFVDHVVALQEQAAKQQNQAPAGTNSGKPVAGLGDARKSAAQSTLGA
jgi:hypothetical protein